LCPDSRSSDPTGPDAAPDSPDSDLFVKEIVREMTRKAGQKCTAIRRALVPAALMSVVQGAMKARLFRTLVGNLRTNGVRMGALAGADRRYSSELLRLGGGAVSLMRSRLHRMEFDL
jgi:oxepin-CoA hydrolase/3-oxo-5,6-dehydrosuberyl-CoA semialdehyde dehydrogenase